MATSNLNKMITYNKKNCVKKTCLIEQFYQNCSGTVIFFKKVNFILSVGYNNENKLKAAFQLLLAKGYFN